MSKCSEVRLFRKVWGKHFCLLTNRWVQTLRGKCLDPRCPESSYLVVLYKISEFNRERASQKKGYFLDPKIDKELEKDLGFEGGVLDPQTDKKLEYILDLDIGVLSSEIDEGLKNVLIDPWWD